MIKSLSFDINVAMNDFIKLSIVVEEIVNLIYLEETLRPYIYDINSVLKICWRQLKIRIIIW